MDGDAVYGELYRRIHSLPDFVSVSQFMQRAAVLARGRIQELEEMYKEEAGEEVDNEGGEGTNRGDEGEGW